MSDLRGSISGWRIALYALLALYFLVPVEAGLVTSFKTSESVIRTAPYSPPGPSGFTLGNWIEAFRALAPGLVNSLVMTVPATVFGALLGSLAAYGLTQLSWRGQVPILALFVAGVFIPYQAVLVPLTQFWSAIPLQVWWEPIWALPLLEPGGDPRLRRRLGNGASQPGARGRRNR